MIDITMNNGAKGVTNEKRGEMEGERGKRDWWRRRGCIDGVVGDRGVFFDKMFFFFFSLSCFVCLLM